MDDGESHVLFLEMDRAMISQGFHLVGNGNILCPL